jgi:hypothetical protein
VNINLISILSCQHGREPRGRSQPQICSSTVDDDNDELNTGVTHFT